MTFLFTFICFPCAANAEDLKIGLTSKYKNVVEVSISNNNISFGFNNNLNNNISLTGTTSIRPANNGYTKLSETFDSFETAKVHARTIGGYPALLASGKWSVFKDSSSANSDMAIAVYNNNELIFLSANGLQFKDTYNNPITLGSDSFRGKIELSKKSSALSCINILDIEEYLYSVVPSEMPSSWPKEALKAQSVAARTYSTKNISAHLSDNFNLCDGSHCQLYKGIGSETASTTQAVQETSGLLVYYNNEPIEAVYHSSSGGYTADSSTVWNESIPYLTSVNDSFETGGKIWTRSFTLNELSSLVGNVGNVKTVQLEQNPISKRVDKLIFKGNQGEKTLEKEEVRTFFSKSSDGTLESRNFDIAFADSNTSTNTSDNNYVASRSGISQGETNNFYSINDKGNVYLINPIAALTNSGIQTILPTTSSTVTQVSNSDTIVFNGKGWGHGVGMSQFGAKSLAEQGYDYKYILKHYYTGIEIKKASS